MWWVGGVRDEDWSRIGRDGVVRRLGFLVRINIVRIGLWGR